MSLDFLKLAQTRYTTKMYDKSKKISQNDIEIIKEILRLTPSSINSQPWKFTIVSNETVKNSLAEASMSNADRVKNSSHLLVLSRVDDLTIFEKHMHDHLHPGVVPYYENVIKTSEAAAKTWFENQVHIALGFILPAIASLNIDSTPMGGIEPLKYKEILKLDGYMPVLAVAMGYRDPEDFNQLDRMPKDRLPLAQIVEEIK